MNFNPNYYTQNMIINTSFSNPFCFYDESSVEFSNNTYTKKTAAETSFSFPIKANVIIFFEIKKRFYFLVSKNLFDRFGFFFFWTFNLITFSN